LSVVFYYRHRLFCRCNLCYCSAAKGRFVYRSDTSRIRIN